MPGSAHDVYQALDAHLVDPLLQARVQPRRIAALREQTYRRDTIIAIAV
jgi:hypothetical protein